MSDHPSAHSCSDIGCKILEGCLEPEIKIHANATYNICDAFRDLVPFVQFRKSEKYPWRSVPFSKVADFRLHFY